MRRFAAAFLLLGLMGCAAQTPPLAPMPTTPPSEPTYSGPAVVYQVEGYGEATVSYASDDGITSDTLDLDGDPVDVWTAETYAPDSLVLSVVSLDGGTVTCRILLAGEVVAENSGAAATCNP